jgi:hypothetical protein
MSLKALAVGGHVSLISPSLTPSATGFDPLLLTGRGITLRLDQRRETHRFRGDEPRYRNA